MGKIGRNLDPGTNSADQFYDLLKYLKYKNHFSDKNTTSTSLYFRAHNVCVCLYIAYIACGSASLYIKTLYLFFCTLALSEAATFTKRYDAKNSPICYIWDTRHMCVLQYLHLVFQAFK